VADTAALRVVERDGELIYKLRCPGCGHEGDIDQDQAAGRVSCDHTDCCDCTYHETVNWLADFTDPAAWSVVFQAMFYGRATLGGAAAFLGKSDLEVEQAYNKWREVLHHHDFW
jgi:hypothetical protein